MLLRDREGVHRRNPHRLAALLDREVFSEPSGDGEFAIHQRKHPTQKEQRAGLGSRDIGAQGRRRLWDTRPSSRKREASLTAELLPAGMDPSIHSDVFARYERGVLEIKARVDDV